MTSSTAMASSMLPAPAASTEEIPDTGSINNRFGITNFGCEKTPFMGVFLYLVARSGMDGFARLSSLRSSAELREYAGVCRVPQAAGVRNGNLGGTA